MPSVCSSPRKRHDSSSKRLHVSVSLDVFGVGAGGEGLKGSTVLPNVLHPLYLFIVKRSLSIVSAHSTASSLEAHVTQGPVNSVLVLVSLMQSVFPVLLPLSLCSRERHLKYWGKQP